MATKQQFQQVNPALAALDPFYRKSPIELMIMQQAMAQNADAQTLAGFAVGKLLSGLFKNWKANYDFRGKQNNTILNPNTPLEERNKLLEAIGSDNQKRANRLMRQLDERGIPYGQVPQANPSPPEITASAPVQPAAPTEERKAPPSTPATPEQDDVLNQFSRYFLGSNNLLTNAADTRPIVSEPFQAPQGVAQSVNRGARDDTLTLWQRYMNTL